VRAEERMGGAGKGAEGRRWPRSGRAASVEKGSRERCEKQKNDSTQFGGVRLRIEGD
jgi:hypothetical protein